MLYDDPILYFKGLTIFKDFSDGRTFYFLPPEAPRVARTAEGGEAGDYALRLVLYRPDPNAPPPTGMEDGGGFLNLDTDLHVTEGLLNQVREEIRRRFGADANLVPVPFVDGSVELVLLGVNRDEPGQPFVREVAGTTVPALYGGQRAAFSTVLDRHGAAVMKAVLEAGGATMALAIYHLTYAGIGPAYNLKITVDYQRVFDHLDLRLKAGVSAGNKTSSFVAKAGFHLLMQELKESRAIKVEEVDPIPGENGRTPTNQEAINEIIGNLMGAKWFKPSLTNAGSMTDLSSAAQGSGSTGTGSGTTGTGGTGTSTPAATGERKNAQWTVDSTTPAPLPSDRGVETFQPATSGTREALVVRGSGATAKVGPTADALQPHALEGNRLAVEVAAGGKQFVEIKWPAAGGTPGERRPVTWTPGAIEGATTDRSVAFEAGTGTLVIRGDGATAKVGASPTALAPHPIAGNRLTVEVGDGQTKHVEITWPAAPGSEETFHLFYDYDRPLETDNDVATYNARRPSPAEPASALRGEQARFLEESRSPTTTRRGPDGLDEWLGTLQAGSSLALHAHSSFENDDSPEKRRLNERLSQRRLDVAQALIAGRFPTPGAASHGHTDSKNGSVATLGNDNAPANSRNGRPQHRVVLITGTKRGGAQTVMRGQLRREPRGSGTGTTESTLRGHFERGGGGGGGGKPGENPTTVQASFEVNLEMIKQEERVTAVYELSSRKARTHTVHPQGQLVFDAIDPTKYVIEADGAIAFFERIEIAASTTAQWQLDGIHSIQIQLRYAPTADGGFQRTGELNLTPAQEADAWKSGVLRDQSLPGEPVVYWYEYKVIVNYTQDVALGNQQGAVSSVGVAQADAEGWIRSDARNLVVHPRDITPAMTVNVASGIMHYDLLERVQLVLSYGPYQQNIALVGGQAGAPPGHSSRARARRCEAAHGGHALLQGRRAGAVAAAGMEAAGARGDQRAARQHPARARDPGRSRRRVRARRRAAALRAGQSRARGALHAQGSRRDQGVGGSPRRPRAAQLAIRGDARQAQRRHRQHRVEGRQERATHPRRAGGRRDSGAGDVAHALAIRRPDRGQDRSRVRGFGERRAVDQIRADPPGPQRDLRVADRDQGRTQADLPVQGHGVSPERSAGTPGAGVGRRATGPALMLS